MLIYPIGACTVTIGVPQESILGPLLFVVHLNDLPIVVKYSILEIYADDAELHSDLGVVEAHVQCDLDDVALWLHSSKLLECCEI